jgi:hypothetical protein
MHAGVARGRTPHVSAPSALAVVWAPAQPGCTGYCAIMPPWATRRYASGPHAEAGPLALSFFFKFFDLIQILQTLKICTVFI